AAYSAWLSRSPHWYGRGGIISEPVIGVGRSGRRYVFGENGPERVTRGTGSGDKQMDNLIAEVRALRRAVADVAPARTGAAVGEALNRGGRRAAYAGNYGG